MKTTLDLEDGLVMEVKKVAAQRGTTMTDVIEEAIRGALAPKSSSARPFKLRWKPVRGRLQPGVDLDDRQALYDVMEGSGWRGDRS
jgi:hypothetical protein